jgi:hypothetical protein
MPPETEELRCKACGALFGTLDAEGVKIPQLHLALRGEEVHLTITCYRRRCRARNVVRYTSTTNASSPAT